MNSKQLAGKTPQVELQRKKLQRMMHQFQENYDLACEALTMVAHNLDFGEVKVRSFYRRRALFFLYLVCISFFLL